MNLCEKLVCCRSGLRSVREFALFSDEEDDVIFEFDGIGKLGKDDAEFARAKRDWIQRENDLRSAGWTIYRVSWMDYEDVVRLRAWVAEVLAPYQASIPASSQNLWAPPTVDCDGPHRRFHMGSFRRWS